MTTTPPTFPVSGLGAERRSTARLVMAMPRGTRERVFGPDWSFPASLPLAIAVMDPPEGDEREWEYFLRRLAPEILVTGWGTPPLPRRWVEGVDCPLRYLCHSAGSVRTLVPRVFLERGGKVSNWGTLVARAVAEHALLLALGALKELPAWARCLREPKPEGRPVSLATRTLSGKRVGIHGFGAIARELITLLQPFGVEAAVHASGVPASLIASFGVQPCDSLAALCGRSEVFFECEALTASSEGSVGVMEIEAFPAGAVFVNVGRGKVVEEAALLRAAESRQLRVAVDVVANEPITPQSRWLSVEGVLVSPHIGGPTDDQMAAVADLVLRNIQAYVAGEEIAGRVTLETYDRST